LIVKQKKLSNWNLDSIVTLFLTKLLITVSALLCLNTTTLFLNAQGRSDMPIADCEFKINKIRDSWKPVKDSIFRYTPFSLKNKGLNYEFLGRIGSLKECCCPTSLASIDSINKKFPKPDAIILFLSTSRVLQFQIEKVKIIRQYSLHDYSDF